MDNRKPQSRVGNYEKDVRTPSTADLAIIAKALNKDIHYFYDQSNQDSKNLAAETPGTYKTNTQVQATEDTTALSETQIEVLEIVLMTVERKFKESDAKTKAKLVAEMFSNYCKLGLKPEDLQTAEETAAKNTI